MINAFYNPEDAILDAKRLGNIASTICVMLISAVLFAAVPMIAMKSLAWKLPVAVLCATIFTEMFSACMLMLAVRTLGAKNPACFDSLTSAVYGSAPFALAAIASSALYIIPYAGKPLAIAVLMIGGVACASAHTRAVKELTSTDNLNAIAALGIVTMAWAAAAAIAWKIGMIAKIAAFF